MVSAPGPAAAMTALVMALGTCGPAAPGPAISRQAIVRGQDDVPERFAGVVRLAAGEATCTATLVGADGPRGFVLTAAHCAITPGRIFPAGVPAQDMTVFFGAEVGSQTALPVTAVHVDPEYDLDRIDDPESLDAWPSDISHDFAMLEVQGVDDAIATTALPWLAPADDRLAPGAAGFVAGFGRDDPGSGQLPSTRQRAAVTVLEIVPMLRSTTDKLVFDERGALPGACWGDSGGPAIFVDDLGVSYVGGVSSTSTTQRGECNDLSYFGRVSAVVDGFLAPTIAGAPPAPAACYACLYQATVPGGECADEVAANPRAQGTFVDCLAASGFDDCRARHPTGAAAYDAVWACFEGPACGAFCSPAHRTVQECRVAYDGAGPCDACVHASCCAEASDCQLEGACSSCLSRLDADDAVCLADERYQRVRSCYDQSCGAECAPYFSLLPALPGEDGSDGEGCDCRAAPPSPQSPATLLVLALLPLLLQRRRIPRNVRRH